MGKFDNVKVVSPSSTSRFSGVTIVNPNKQIFKGAEIKNATGQTLNTTKDTTSVKDKLASGFTSFVNFLKKTTPPIGLGLQVGVDTAKGIKESVQNLPSKLKSDITEAAKTTSEGISNKSTLGTIKGLAKGALRPTADIVSTAISPISSSLNSLMEQTGVQSALNKGAEYVVDKSGITDIPSFQKFAQAHPNAEEDFNRAILLFLTSTGSSDLKGMLNKTGDLAKSAKSDLLEGIKVKNEQTAIKNTGKASDLSRQVLQPAKGKPFNPVEMQKQLSSFEPKDVKTYLEMKKVTNDKIADLSKKLDQVLETKPEQVPLQEWKIKVGNASHNYVQDAIQQLGDYYQKTNNVEKLQLINNIAKNAQERGISIREVNDLAKLHGQELNAFNSSGELASGLSKQAAENTRTGLKTSARQKFDNPVYEAADKELASLMKVKELSKKMDAAVKDLEQRITQRGFGEKVGRLVFQVVDKFTGGGLKGFLQSFIPRSAGLKLLNAIDLEKSLSKNLQKIQKMTQPLSEPELIRQLESFLNENK